MTSDPPTLAEVRAEMARLTHALMRANQRYLEREEEIQALHAKGAPNFNADLITLMNNDVLLTMHSGASKTLAVLVTGFAAAIQAEIAYAQAHGRKRSG